MASETFGEAAQRWIETRRIGNTRSKYTTILTAHLAVIADRKLSARGPGQGRHRSADHQSPPGKRDAGRDQVHLPGRRCSGRLPSHRLDKLICKHVAGIRELIYATPAQADQIASHPVMGDAGLAVRLQR